MRARSRAVWAVLGAGLVLVLALRLRPAAVPVVAARGRSQAGGEARDPAAARQFQRQLDLLERQADSRSPYQPVTLTAEEADAWFAGPGASHLPQGVTHLRLTAQPGEIGGTADMDFDRLPHGSISPLLAELFTGQHTLSAEARLNSVADGVAHLTVTSVAIDGENVPLMLVDAAIRAFIQPSHPEISRNFTVQLPAHVTGIALGNGWARLEY